MDKKEINSYKREYPLAYTTIDVTNKVILDIGADVGTSAQWFLKHNAKKVICFSMNEQMIFDNRIEWNGKWQGEYVKADVLKIDCEGCECKLTERMIEKYNEWYIAIHTFSKCFDNMMKYLDTKGKVVFITEDFYEYLYAKVSDC
jgi:hypothetical protein